MAGITLDDMMAQQPPEGGTWVRCTDRQPPRYGQYTVIKRGRSRHYDFDNYLWNSSGWVTHGHSLSYAVEAWAEKEAGNHD